nr:NADH dehydrogenase subunit 3 [Exechonella vieirai]
MTMLSMHFKTSALFSLFLMFIILLISSRHQLKREKQTPFECGFDPKESARLPFSMRFFLLAILLLIFDIEVTLLLPLILGMKMLMIKTSLMASAIFLAILLLGIVHEWNQGSLSWVK